MKLTELFADGPQIQGGLENLIVTLFSARDMAHKLHLLTSSLSQHLALEEFYNGIVPLADELAEVAQGKGGLLTGLLNSQTDVPFTCDPVTFSKELNEYLDKLGHARVPASNGPLNNIYDEIRALSRRMNYKLTNLIN